MSLSDDLAAFDARAAARGVRFIGSVSPDVSGATDDEVAMLFVGDVKGVLRDLRRLSASVETVEAQTA